MTSPLLLHQHARECVADQAEPASTISRNRVTHQPKPMCHASGGPKHPAGSGGGTRTHNLRINSPPLCQLSYPGPKLAESTNGPLIPEVGLPLHDRLGGNRDEAPFPVPVRRRG